MNKRVINKLFNFIKRERLDGFLETNDINISYITKQYNLDKNSFLLIRKDCIDLFIDYRFYEESFENDYYNIVKFDITNFFDFFMII